MLRMHVDDAPTPTPEEAEMKIDYGEDDDGVVEGGDDDALMQDEAQTVAVGTAAGGAAATDGDGMLMLLDDSLAPTPTPAMDADDEPEAANDNGLEPISLPPNTLFHSPPPSSSPVSTSTSTSSSSGPSYTSIAPPTLPFHPGFSSPPLINVSSNELQLSALGHSAAAVTPSRLSSAPFSLRMDHPAPIVSPTPGFDPAQLTANDHETSDARSLLTPLADGTQQSLLVPQRALASQHQHSSDDVQTQDQAIEALGPGTTRIVQEQQLRQQSEDDPDVDGVAKQENEVIIRQGLDGHIIVETEQRNSVPPRSVSASASASNASGSTSEGDDEQQQQRNGGQVRQINSVKVVEAVGASSGLLKRPLIDKAVLEFFGLGDEAALQISEDDDAEEESVAEGETADAPPRPAPPPLAPTVLLQFGEDRYTMFRAAPVVEDGQDAEDLPILFGERKDHHLYYEQIEALFEALHASLPGLESTQAEYSLEIDGLGIVLQEDNVYTREVSLYDFHRLHSGCGLPGRMLVKLAECEGPRFPTGFNALMQHIMRVADGREDSLAAGGEEEEKEEAYEEALEEVEAGEAEAEVEAEAKAEAEAEVVPKEAEAAAEGSSYDEREWHETTEGGEEYGEAEEGSEVYEAAEDEEAEEEAYEELNAEDLAAVVEGAQKDYVLAQDQVEEANGEAMTATGEEVNGHSVNGHEPVAVEEWIAKSITELRSEPLELSYDTPEGTGFEPPAIPLDKREAVVEAAAATAEQNVKGTTEAQVVEEFPQYKTEIPKNGSVVIDYDEVAVKPSIGEGGKRAHASVTDEDDAPGDDDDATSESKRPRLSDPETDGRSGPEDAA
ncbi:hypothetical protein MVLG_06626 [Microbotryum lychnidis-dioicae p1A1 Lamole]|uniref:Uncharacterized protein n=1 Tax=Microbotryum lychnidis-dioicae (strain p1A1 Lamole / MvSl-1064) TaxID=683840 RepID=U5HHV5_USTV1|nr:hypothetical protein MVLG_06626 [Microbotryum lychnidis-dioicae p1A1 Lamole]|eukprot:KDE02835.1 hypothetical protein MVLG_06626 [Microbotryum lychnidis-dioicae p1A1 Lamole]